MDCGQLRAARALMRWTQADLSERSGVSIASIKKFEALEGPIAANASTVRSLERAFVDAGVVFLDAGETPDGGPGIRLRSSQG